MHKLGRCVRFSINPFLPQDDNGFNSFASKPTGQGLALFFELVVELTGDVEANTGFVVNVADIDKKVREFVVPLFAERIRENFQQRKHIPLSNMVELLRSAWGQLAGKFKSANLNNLSLELNPFRKIAINQEQKMLYFSEKFEFAATHKLWNENFSEQKNLELFGNCANPSGHGHNYVVEVTVGIFEAENNFNVIAFEKTVDEKLIKLLDHKNLNTDVPEFGRINPTVENITALAWEKLAGQFGQAKLHCVTVWETDKTYCSYYGR